VLFGAPLAFLINVVGVFTDQAKALSIVGLVISGLTCLGMVMLFAFSVLASSY